MDFCKLLKFCYNRKEIIQRRESMKQHLIVIDLDGTTLHNQSKLTSTTIQALRAVSDLGHLVCIVTGRPYRNSSDIYREIGIEAPMVNFNGALCHFPGRDHYIPSYHLTL